MAQPVLNITGFGNPLLDISVVADQAFFDKYKIQPATATLAEAKDLPMYDEIAKFDKVGYVAGGATQNSIRGAEWMSIEKGHTSYVGSIGDDENGRILAETAKKAGVQTHYFVSQKHGTGRCAVLVKDSERSLIADLAAANDYSHDHYLSDDVQALVKSTGIFYSAGFFLTVSPQTVVEFGKHAAAENKILAVNLAAVFIINFFWEKLQDVLPYADFVIGNEDEAAAYAEKAGLPDKTDLQAAALAIAALPKVNANRPRVVVFTQGKNPTIVATEGKVELFPVELLDKSLIVDTNGAGDAFVGGFLAGLASHKSIKTSVAAGQYCAKQVIQREGAQYPETAPTFNFEA